MNDELMINIAETEDYEIVMSLYATNLTPAIIIYEKENPYEVYAYATINVPDIRLPNDYVIWGHQLNYPTYDELARQVLGVCQEKGSEKIPVKYGFASSYAFKLNEACIRAHKELLKRL